MKLSKLVILFLFFSLTVNAQQLLDQKIDFTVEQISLKKALKQLSKHTGYDIAFSSSFFKEKKNISHTFEQKTIREILDILLEGYPLAYRSAPQRILLYKSKASSYTISGYIEDAASGERLIAANIYSTAHNRATTSNEYGFFSLILPSGTNRLNFSYLGYAIAEQEIDLQQNVRLTKRLEQAYNLPEIIVQPKDSSWQQSAEAGMAYYLDKEKMTAVPGLGGEADVIRQAQLMPGIQSPVDGLGGLSVRGGDNGQNLLLLDGVPVYIPYHLLGLYSIYNPSTVNSAKVLKGSFPARYGGRLSSVFDVRTREGNKYKFAAEVGANLTTTHALIEGPIKKEKGSFLLAGRLGHPSLILEPSLEELYFMDDEGNMETKFNDFNIKLNYQLSQKDRVYLSLFHGFDEFEKYFEEEIEENVKELSEFEFRWRNTIGSFRWNHQFSDKLFVNTTFQYSFFDFELSDYSETIDDDPDEDDEFTFTDSRSENRDIGLHIDFHWLPNTRHNLRTGLSISRKVFVPDLTYFDNEDQEIDDLDDVNIEALQGLISSPLHITAELVAYLEDQIQLSNKCFANLGLRATNFIGENKNFFSVEPRVSINFQPTEKINLRLGGSQMRQYLHLISTAALSLPNDLWTPASADILPQLAWQGDLSLQYQPSKKLNLEISGYYKAMKNLYAYPDNPEYLELVNDDDLEKYLTKGEGESYGIESFLQYAGKNWGGSSAVSFSKSFRQYEEQNLNLEYPFEYDQRWQVKLFAYKKLGKKFRLSANWIYHSGNPKFQFDVLELAPNDPTLINPPGNKNKARALPYHRLDLQLGYTLRTGKFLHKASMGVYNAYNQNNVAYYLVEDDDPGQFQTDPIFSIPFMPSLSYTLKFN